MVATVAVTFPLHEHDSVGPTLAYGWQIVRLSRHLDTYSIIIYSISQRMNYAVRSDMGCDILIILFL